MTEESKFNSKTILFLVIGLVIGIGISYMVMSNQYKPKVSANEEQLSNLQQEAATFSTNHQALIDEKESLESTEETLENIISNSRRQKNTLQQDVNTLDRDINTYQEKIGSLSLLVDAEDGYDVFRSYGLSFHYPKGMTIQFDEFQEYPISGEYGTIQGEIKEHNKDATIGLVWQKVDFIPDIEADVEDMMSNFVTEVESKGYIIQKSEMSITKCDEHDLYYNNAKTTQNGEILYVYYSGWYCEYRSLAYRLFYFSSKSDIHENFQTFVNNIQCHN